MAPKVAILGTDEHAAMACRALQDCNCRNIRVFTLTIDPPPAGSFYFRWLPESVRYDPCEEIAQLSIGSAEGYQQKLSPVQMNIEQQTFPHTLRVGQGYDPYWIWDSLWGDASIDLVTGILSDQDIRELAQSFDHIFSSYPTQTAKRSQPAPLTLPVKRFPKGSAPSEEVWELVDGAADNFILYSGEQRHTWVRMCYLFEHLFLEYPYNTNLDIQQKDLKHYTWRNVLHPDTLPWEQAPAPNVHLVGSAALWDPAVSVQDTYQKVLEVMGCE